MFEEATDSEVEQKINAAADWSQLSFFFHSHWLRRCSRNFWILDPKTGFGFLVPEFPQDKQNLSCGSNQFMTILIHSRTKGKKVKNKI